MDIQTILNLKMGFVPHAYAIQIVCMSFASNMFSLLLCRSFVLALRSSLFQAFRLVECGSQWGASQIALVFFFFVNFSPALYDLNAWNRLFALTQQSRTTHFFREKPWGRGCHAIFAKDKNKFVQVAIQKRNYF